MITELTPQAKDIIERIYKTESFREVARNILTCKEILQAQGLSNEWVSVESDNEPEINENVLMSHIRDGWVQQGYLRNTGEWYNDFDSECPCYPTHWMPLPPTPPTDK